MVTKWKIRRKGCTQKRSSSLLLLFSLGYLLRFPHNTPPEIELLMRTSKFGDWVVIALEYPRYASCFCCVEWCVRG